MLFLNAQALIIGLLDEAFTTIESMATGFGCCIIFLSVKIEWLILLQVLQSFFRLRSTV